MIIKDLTPKEIDEACKLLQDDENYYGEYGRQFRSNSDIGRLLGNPQSFGERTEDSKALALGRLFHHILLEPEKADLEFCVDASTRTTKKYKEYCAEHNIPFALLCTEVDKIEELTSKITSNIQFHDDIYDPNNNFEVPMVGKLHGMWWKGKADILCPDRIIDLKTTWDIHQFAYSARKYNYDSQAYIYGQLFGRPLEFYAIDKTSGQLGIFKCSEEFLQRGKDKVERAVKMYERFFIDDAPESVENYYIEQELY